MQKMINVKVDRLIIEDMSVRKSIIDYLLSLEFKEIELDVYKSMLSVVEIRRINSKLIIDIYAEEKDNVITSSKTKNFNLFLAIGISSFIKKIINVIKRTSPNCLIIHSFTLKKSNSLLKNKIIYLFPIILGAIIVTIIFYLLMCLPVGS